MVSATVTATPSAPSVWEWYCQPVRTSMRSLLRRCCHSSGSSTFWGRCALRVGLIDSIASICASGRSASWHPAEFGPGEGGAVRDAPQLVHRGTEAANVALEADLTPDLHRPRREHMRSGVALRLAACLHDGAVDAISREQQRRRGAHRPGADYQHVAVVAHVGSSSRALLRRSLPDGVFGRAPAGNSRMSRGRCPT